MTVSGFSIILFVSITIDNLKTQAMQCIIYAIVFILLHYSNYSIMKNSQFHILFHNKELFDTFRIANLTFLATELFKK